MNNFENLNKQMWNLDETFAKFILPRLLYYKITNTFSTPGDYIYYDSLGNELYVAQDEWEEDLTTMITAFRLIIEDCTTDEPIVEQGLRLFGQYFRSFWM